MLSFFFFGYRNHAIFDDHIILSNLWLSYFWPFGNAFLKLFFYSKHYLY